MGDFSGDGANVLSGADLGGPLEKIGFDDALQIGMCVEGVAVEEGFGGVLCFVFDVDAEVVLEYEGDECCEIGVADE